MEKSRMVHSGWFCWCCWDVWFCGCVSEALERIVLSKLHAYVGDLEILVTPQEQLTSIAHHFYFLVCVSCPPCLPRTFSPLPPAVSLVPLCCVSHLWMAKLIFCPTPLSLVRHCLNHWKVFVRFEVSAATSSCHWPTPSHGRTHTW